MPMSLAKEDTSASDASSCISTPTICRPWEAYCFCSSTSHGVSILQGSHHVAQKFSRTAFPLKSERWTVLPSIDCNAKSWADWLAALGAGTAVNCAERRVLYTLHSNIPPP